MAKIVGKFSSTRKFTATKPRKKGLGPHAIDPILVVQNDVFVASKGLQGEANGSGTKAYRRIETPKARSDHLDQWCHLEKSRGLGCAIHVVTPWIVVLGME